MKLYYTPASCSMAAHIILNELKLQFTLEKVDLKTHTTESGEDFYQVNAKGSVPALYIKENTVLTENVAVLTYLAEHDPQQQMIATSGLQRARIIEWLGFINSQLHRAYLPLFFKPLNETEKAEAYAVLNRYFSYIDAYLAKNTSQFLVSEHFGPADAYLFVVSNWSSYVKHDLSPYEHVNKLRDLILARPAVQSTLKKEGLI